MIQVTVDYVFPWYRDKHGFTWRQWLFHPRLRNASKHGWLAGEISIRVLGLAARVCVQAPVKVTP